MTLTIDLPLSAETWLNQESERTGIPVRELAARMLVERLKLETTGPVRAPRPGFASDLFQGVDVDALLATPVPGIEEYMPE
jgi:hypothetical protein